MRCHYLHSLSIPSPCYVTFYVFDMCDIYLCRIRLRFIILHSMVVMKSSLTLWSQETSSLPNKIYSGPMVTYVISTIFFPHIGIFGERKVMYKFGTVQALK